jgi:hypothetical protein
MRDWREMMREWKWFADGWLGHIKLVEVLLILGILRTVNEWS